MDQDPGAIAKNVLYGLVNSDLPDSEKAPFRLRQEARIMVTAGTDTTGKLIGQSNPSINYDEFLQTLATTLSYIIYHLLSNPPALERLGNELVAALPNADTLPTGAQVEHLPYLTAVIREGLRLHPGTTFRQVRVAPNEDLYFKTQSKDWVIPRGTPMSMSARLTQRHPNLFPDPNAFKPERWLKNPRLDKYLLTFSRGTRQCLG